MTLLRETLRRVPGYFAVGAVLIMTMMTALLQQTFGQSSAVVIDIPVSTVVLDLKPGESRTLETASVDPSYVGLTCSVKVIAENQGSVHPGNDLIVSSGGSSVTAFDVEASPGKVTPASGDLVLGDTISVTLHMGRDGVFSAGVLVKLTCEDPDIEVCRDGVLMPIKQSQRLGTDTDPPCPEPPVVTCDSLVASMIARDKYEFTISASAANATITSYDIDFGDGNSENIPSSALSVTTDHMYTAPGTYNTAATVNYAANSQYFSSGSEECDPEIVVVSDEPVYDLSLVKQVRNNDGAWVGANNPATSPVFGEGDTVFWRVTVRNDLDTTATGVAVTDIFPSGDLNYVGWSGDGSFDAGSLTWTIGTVNADDVFRLVIETTVKDTDQAKTIANWAGITAMNEADNDSVVDDDIDGNQDDEDPAHIRIKPDAPPKPYAVCNALSVIGQNSDTITFQATSTVKNTAVTGYVFSLDGNEVQNSASDTYVFDQTTPGSYELTAVVVTEDLTSKVGGCRTTIVIEDDHELACSAINVLKKSRTEFNFQVLSFTTGDASVTNYELVEKATGVVLGTNGDGSFSLTRDVAGDYTVTAYVLGTVAGEDVRVTSTGCETTITVDPPEEEPAVHDCLGLRIDQLSQTKFSASPSFTEGTNPSRYVYRINGKVVQDGNKASLEFVAKDEGTYSVHLTAYITVDGQEVKMGCGSSVTVVENEVEVLGTTTIPPTPKHLPNTGSGETLTIALASLLTAGMGAHYTARHFYLRQFKA